MPEAVKEPTRHRRKLLNSKEGVVFFNAATGGHATHTASQAFVEAIRDELHEGYGFVPFVGAGFSVTAGIPIIHQLMNYLQRCICFALGAESSDAEIWNPRTDKWPPFIDRLRNRPNEWWQVLVREKHEAEKPKWGANEGHIDPAICLEALGAMAEWRTALAFLSRIILRPGRGAESWQLELGVPEQEVVDACFREVMAHKKPTLNHKMLASLHGLLRIDLILTTNFDDLIEKSFEELRSPLEVFEVHIDDKLPDFTAISGGRSVIKMHGSQSSLRADYSLDAPPNHEDVRTFCEYLAGKKLSDKEFQGKRLAERLKEELNYARVTIAKKAAKNVLLSLEEHSSTVLSERQFIKHGTRASLEAFDAYFHRSTRDLSNKYGLAERHLLLMGVGANERRTIEFVLQAMKVLENLKIFWVCYSEREYTNIVGKLGRKHTESASTSPRIFIVRHTDTGLFLLHMYQAIRKSLPSSGAVFPSATRLSLPPLPWREQSVLHRHQKSFDSCKQEIAACVDPRKQASASLIVIAGPEDMIGIASTGAEVYRMLERDNVCLWLDMGDIHSADGVFEAFQEAAYHKLGESDWTPLYSQKDEPSLGKHMPLHDEIKRIVESSNRPWILFLDAREVPGSNREDSLFPNGWMDNPEEPMVGTANVRGMRRLLVQFALANDKDPKEFRTPSPQKPEVTQQKIKVVLLCTSSDRVESHLLKSLPEISKELSTKRPQAKSMSSVEPPCLLVSPTTLPRSLSTSDIVNQILKWMDSVANESQDRCRFVQALVSMQRPRHMAVAWAKCMNAGATLTSETDSQRDEWLTDLEKLRLLRRLDGGFIWLQARVRQGLRRCMALTQRTLEEDILKIRTMVKLDSLNEQSLSVLKKWDPAEQQASVHVNLSTWYRKVFDSTGAPQAIFDAVDHLCFSAESILRHAKSSGVAGQTALDLEAANKLKLAAGRVSAAREILGEHQFLIQTHGHPRASLRRLDFVRDYWVTLRSPSTDTIKSLLDQEAWIEAEGDLLHLRTEIATFQRVAAEVARSICREIGEEGEAFERLREVAVRTISGSLMTMEEIHQHRELSRNKLSIEFAESLHKAGRHGSLQTAVDTNSARHYELIRWWRWCGLLGISSRCLEEASKSLSRALSVASNRHWDFESDPTVLESMVLNHWCLEMTSTYKFHLETLSSLEQAASCLVLRSNILDRKVALLQNAMPKSEVDEAHLSKERLLVAAGRFASKGLEFVDQIQTSGQEREDHDFELMWCKSRLLMQAGLASMVIPDRKNAGRHSMGFMGDSAACLGNALPDRWSSDLALVELRRAEIRIQEAAAIRIYTVRKGSPPTPTKGFAFEAWTYDRLFSRRIDAEMRISSRAGAPSKRMPPPLEVAAKLRKHFRGVVKGFGHEREDELRKGFREIRGRAKDALRYLDNAEPVLRERRRNVWWTTWYFERRLRVIAMLLWVSIIDPGEAVPFLGLEASMRQSDTIADVLLTDTLRMIRLDTYRLSLVLLSYASCARALQIRLRLDEMDGSSGTASTNLIERLSTMRDKLSNGIAQLKDTVKVRTKADGQHQVVSPVIQEVVAAIVERVEMVRDGLPRSHRTE
jgi:hypothetical protein